MRYVHLISLGIAGIFVPVAHAQISVETVVDKQYYLPGEAIVVGVKVANFSGQTIHLGSDPQWIDLTLETKNGYIIPTLNPISVPGEFEVESTTAATRRFSITPFFDVTRIGHYILTTRIRIAAWNQTFTAEPVDIEILGGVRLWTREFGVPAGPDQTTAPEVRKYVLIQTLRQNQMKLWLSIFNADETKIVNTLPVSKMVSFSDPDPQLDQSSNLHLLVQNGRISFKYTVINPEGRVLIRQTYLYGQDGKPRLRFGPGGIVAVANGIRQPNPDDIPKMISVAPEDYPDGSNDQEEDQDT